MIVLDVLLWSLTIGIGVPIGVFVVEVILASIGPVCGFRAQVGSAELPDFTVIIPAHNEASTIGRTLDILLGDGLGGDQVLVVADNCTDATAEIARDHGATVLERHECDRLGKGYALAAGLSHLRTEPPKVVVIVDADCRVEPGAILSLVSATTQRDRPTQLVYLLAEPQSSGYRAAVSWLAVVFKNLVRPRGLGRIGGPCHVLGSGFALPWSVVDQVNLATGNIVEDMQLGIDLALAGWPPTFCEGGRVLSDMAPSDSASKTQRTRWEHGHLQTLLTQVPRLLFGCVRRLDPRLLLMALDLAVPPLSLLVIGWIGATVLCMATAMLGASNRPAMTLACLGVAMVLAVFVGWFRFARQTIPLSQLLAIPAYVLWKIPIYCQFILSRQTAWVRTGRE